MRHKEQGWGAGGMRPTIRVGERREGGGFGGGKKMEAAREQDWLRQEKRANSGIREQ